MKSKDQKFPTILTKFDNRHIYIQSRNDCKDNIPLISLEFSSLRIPADDVEHVCTYQKQICDNICKATKRAKGKVRYNALTMSIPTALQTLEALLVGLGSMGCTAKQLRGIVEQILPKIPYGCFNEKSID